MFVLTFKSYIPRSYARNDVALVLDNLCTAHPHNFVQRYAGFASPLYYLLQCTEPASYELHIIASVQSF
jgi:hypothetical protein